jgi:hypothetical protein
LKLYSVVSLVVAEALEAAMQPVSASLQHMQHIDDSKSIDSWGANTQMTGATALIQVETGGYACAKHGGHYDDRNALCQHCDLEFSQAREALKEKQWSVQQRLQELNMNDQTTSKDILQGLEVSMELQQQQWATNTQQQQQPQSPEDHLSHVANHMEGTGMQPNVMPHGIPSVPSPLIHSNGSSNPMINNQNHIMSNSPMMSNTPLLANNPMMQQQQQQASFSGINGMQQHHHIPVNSSLPPRHPNPMQPVTISPPMQQHHQQQQHLHQQQQQQQQQVLNSNQNNSQPNNIMNNNGGMPPYFGGGMQGMSMTNSMDAFTMQMQRMQQMQDWMLWQKESELQQCRQQLDESQRELNQLRIDNALLTEKLTQQEQRMQHELKLIKLAAIQSRQKRAENQQQQQQPKQIVTVLSQPDPLWTPHPFDDQNLFETESPNSNRHASLNNIPDGSVTTTASKGDSDEGKDAFDSNSITWPSSGSVQRSKPTTPTAYKRKSGPLTTPRFVPHAKAPKADADDSSQPGSIGPEQAPDETTAAKPKATPGKHPWESRNNNNNNNNTNQADEANRRNNISDMDEYSLDAASIGQVPHDLMFEGPSTVPLEETITTGTELLQLKEKTICEEESVINNDTISATASISTNDPFVIPSNLPNITTNKNQGVSFVDDSASAGQTVASSTFGEDRNKVSNQTILDPYGDRGKYTGIILRSTGMPHGSGEMIYQEGNYNSWLSVCLFSDDYRRIISL